MDLSLYNKEILRLAASISRDGRLETPDASASAHSRICGSRITVDIKLDGDVITDYAQELRACAIGQASASVIADVIVGLGTTDVIKGEKILQAILKDRTPPPPGPWIKLEPFLSVADYEFRHDAALLPFKALRLAIEDLPRI